LKRPSIAELFRPALRRTTVVTTILFACAYGAAFGAIQMTPQIVPGLVNGLTELPKLRKQVEAAQLNGQDTKELKQQIRGLGKRQEQVVSGVQTYQEIGGLVGRCLLAILAVYIVGRGKLLRLFQIPGLLLIPLIFWFPATSNLGLFKWGIFVAGFCTIAQFSFWGNYLPRVYPTHLRGTGEGFAANVGGRMIGTSAAFFTTQITSLMAGAAQPAKLAHAAALVALLVYAVGLITSFWLTEPKQEELPD
jgi:hypothetical protein